MLEKWKERNQERQVFWKTHLEKWSESGMTQREYCKQNDLIAHRFTYWKIKFKNNNLPVKFVQVSPEPMRIDPSDLKLNIGPGLQIEIPDGFSRITLERVLSTLNIL